MKAALNHVSKYVPKNDYFYWHLQYKQTRSGVREGGGCIYIYIHISVYVNIYIYVWYPPQRSTEFNATTDIFGYFRLQDCPEVCWQNLGSRLKPIEPIEISIGTTIQDPRSKGRPLSNPIDPRSKIAQRSSLGILDLGSWIVVPIEISIGSIGFNRDPRFCQQTSGQSWILDPIPD